jgi:phage shock protein C
MALPSARPMNTARPTLSRSINDRVLAGVIGGIAHRFGWNSTLLRFIYVVLSVVSVAFPGILVYLILWLLMPEGSD